jgi:hypothetical protein
MSYSQCVIQKARDADLAARLWNVSEQLTDVAFAL